MYNNAKLSFSNVKLKNEVITSNQTHVFFHRAFFPSFSMTEFYLIIINRSIPFLIGEFTFELYKL